MARRGEGETVLVTGASMGIGFDLAECFARAGYELIDTARSAGALQKEAEGTGVHVHRLQSPA